MRPLSIEFNAFSLRHAALLLGFPLLLASPLGCDGAPEDPIGDDGIAAGSEEPAVGESQAALIVCGATSDLVPAMTSPSAPSGSVTRSGAYSSSYEAWQAFDSSPSSMWISAVNQTPASIGYEWADGPRVVTSYAITFANGSLTTRAPKVWTLRGWNGAAWVVVDTRTNETGWPGFGTRLYTVASPGSYSKYQLQVTDDNDVRTGVVVVSIGRLQLFGCATAGNWTAWLDRDNPGGNGDYETLADFLLEGQACAAPAAIECQTTSGVDFTQTGEVYACNTTQGGYCLNASQPDGSCEDYRVRFLCP